MSLKNLYNLVCRQLISTSILFTHPLGPLPNVLHTANHRHNWLTFSENIMPIPTSRPCVLHLPLLKMFFAFCCLFVCLNCLLREVLFVLQDSILPQEWAHASMFLWSFVSIAIATLSYCILILIFVCVAFSHHVLKAHHMPNASRELGIGCHLVTT